MEAWIKENPSPADLFSVFSEKPRPLCEWCGRDLLDPPEGLVALWRVSKQGNKSVEQYVDVHVACKGNCDKAVSAIVPEPYSEQLLDGWEDIGDFCIPFVFLRRMLAFINGMHKGDSWTDAAFSKFKDLIITVYPHIVRQATTAEQEKANDVIDFPAFLGGLG